MKLMKNEGEEAKQRSVRCQSVGGQVIRSGAKNEKRLKVITGEGRKECVRAVRQGVAPVARRVSTSFLLAVR